MYGIGVEAFTRVFMVDINHKLLNQLKTLYIYGIHVYVVQLTRAFSVRRSCSAYTYDVHVGLRPCKHRFMHPGLAELN